MLSTRVFGLACTVAVFVCLMAAPVSAQPFDKRTMFTFSGPVTLPGVTLPAGQYLFRLADPNSSAKVVQVLNADGTYVEGLDHSHDRAGGLSAPNRAVRRPIARRAASDLLVTGRTDRCARC